MQSILGEESNILPVITEENIEEKKIDIPDELAILPLRNTVLFPGVLIPITVGREKSINLVKEIYRKDKIIGTIAQKDIDIEDPKPTDLFQVGTVATIVKILEMPDGITTVIIQGLKRFNIIEVLTEEPYLKAKVGILPKVASAKKNKEYNAIIGSIKDLALKVIQLSPNIPPEAAFAIKNIENSSFLINYISSNSDVKSEEKQFLLENNSEKERATKLMEYLQREIQMLELKNEVQSKVKTDIDQQQRKFMLHQQLKTIQDELGGDNVNKEVEDLKAKSTAKKWPDYVQETFDNELEKLQRINPISPDHSLQLNYLQTLIDLPWNEYTKDNFDLKNAENILNNDHYALDEVKERILEYIAVLKLKGDLKSPILCLYGPPGSGKTSLGKSIASAINRKYARISLGGLHDESEIRGHRKTYIGALPGRIIQSIKKAKFSNPVFILDEIDKVGNDFRGDPSSALLEVLDPEQNHAFYDNYLELEYDLSNVMFIATANTLSSIKPALLDRMELIHVSGYIVEEKIEIAKRHLIPKQLKAHGVKISQLFFPKNVIEKIVEDYTRESGVRTLDKKIAKVVRGIAKRIAFGENPERKLTIDGIVKILGAPEYQKNTYEGNDIAGVVTGLAWTAVGGKILFVETSLSKGKEKLTITGNLGDVMKESAIIALEYLKSNASHLGLKQDIFSKWNVHLHVPEGATPKDGPSAGVTMVTSMASAFTQRKVKHGLAMTGEITLKGKVLPVGGIKEKILAAKRAKIKEIILSKDNKRDIEEINEIYLKGLDFIYVDTIIDVLDYALLKQKVQNPVEIS
jgi:ATP-dependent Lon protease